MNKETIQKKKQDLEVEFKKVDESRQKALAIVNECMQQMVRMQGAYIQLDELEKELDKESIKENLEKVE